MAEAGLPRYVLLTDAPPLKEGGYGCHVLAWNWVHAMESDVRLVITRPFHRALEPAKLAEPLSAPVCFYPDLSRVRGLARLPAIKSLLEVLLVIFWLPKIVRAVRVSGADRIFGFFGGNPWFLLVCRIVAAGTRLPLDVYLVEDLEESSRIHRLWLAARLARWYEPRLLRRAARIFAICPGFAEFLAAKHGVKVECMPPVILAKPIQHRAFVVQRPDVRDVTFIGGVNTVNQDALCEFLSAIAQWNMSSPPFQLRLLVMSYSEPAYLRALLGSSPHLEVLHRPPHEVMSRRMLGSWAVFIPYSFAEEMRVMVSTAFPTKLTDSLPIGRPILVYGPPYASVPRYFAENGLPLSVTRREALVTVLREIHAHDTVALMQRYQTVIEQFHAPERLRRMLAVGLQPGANTSA
jgi:hypothetical protein